MCFTIGFPDNSNIQVSEIPDVTKLIDVTSPEFLNLTPELPIGTDKILSAEELSAYIGMFKLLQIQVWSHILYVLNMSFFTLLLVVSSSVFCFQKYSDNKTLRQLLELVNVESEFPLL